MRIIARPLLAAASLSVGGFIVLMGIVVGLARGQQVPPPLPELARCGDQVCYLGIQPGQMSWAETTKRLTGDSTFNFEIRDSTNYSTAIAYHTPNRIDYTFVKSDFGWVSLIMLQPQPKTVTVGELVAHFGAPCWIYLEPEGYRALNVLVYPGIEAAFLSPDRTFRPDTFAVSLVLSNRVKTCTDLGREREAAPLGRTFYAWRGFSKRPAMRQ